MDTDGTRRLQGISREGTQRAQRKTRRLHRSGRISSRSPLSLRSLRPMPSAWQAFAANHSLSEAESLPPSLHSSVRLKKSYPQILLKTPFFFSKPVDKALPDGVIQIAEDVPQSDAEAISEAEMLFADLLAAHEEASSIDLFPVEATDTDLNDLLMEDDG